MHDPHITMHCPRCEKRHMQLSLRAGQVPCKYCNGCGYEEDVSAEGEKANQVTLSAADEALESLAGE